MSSAGALDSPARSTRGPGHDTKSAVGSEVGPSIVAHRQLELHWQLGAPVVSSVRESRGLALLGGRCDRTTRSGVVAAPLLGILLVD
jgi:hypothetical protein